VQLQQQKIATQVVSRATQVALRQLQATDALIDNLAIGPRPLIVQRSSHD
jgi:hypothetical protein